MADEDDGRKQGRLRIPRSRGAVTGILLIVLGAWGALIPLVGPYIDFAFTPDEAFTFTAGRFWLEILPGVVTAVGGLLLLITANRAVAVLGGYLAVAAGAWFVVGMTVASYLPDDWGDIGMPIGSELTQTFETLTFFNGLGVLIVFLAAQALGRVTVRSLRDVEAVEKHRASQAVTGTDRDPDRDQVGRQDVRSRDPQEAQNRDTKNRDTQNRDAQDREPDLRDDSRDGDRVDRPRDLDRDGDRVDRVRDGDRDGDRVDRVRDNDREGDRVGRSGDRGLTDRGDIEAEPADGTGARRPTSE